MIETDLHRFLIALHKDLMHLQEREAKFGGDVPLKLLHQINDYKQAIALTKQAIMGELSKNELIEALKPLELEVSFGVQKLDNLDFGRQLAEIQLQETALQCYFDRMSALLFGENLHPVDEWGLDDENSEIPINHKARIMARTLTLNVLQSLNGERKGRVLQFLYEADLINDGNATVNLRGADFSETHLHDADLSGADLSGVNFSKAELSGIILGEANLCEANFDGAILNGVDLRCADLRRASLYSTMLIEAQLFDAKLIEADLNNSELMEANLWLADLSGANLKDADLSYTILNGANLSNTNLMGTELDKAKYGFDTIWPENFDPEKAGAEEYLIEKLLEEDD